MNCHKNNFILTSDSGERCFVCGDELILSETVSSKEEIFQKACCYLNVQSDRAWFKTNTRRFFAFCDSCTNEVRKIHQLYQQVEEVQSVIFKTIENVEKKLADAEIVDNWMAEAPAGFVKQFEGFRKQVLISEP